MNNKKILIGILYFIFAVVIVTLFPKILLSGFSSNPIGLKFWNSASGFIFLKLLQFIFIIILIIVPIISMKNTTSNSGGLFKKNTVDQGSAHRGNLNDLKGLILPINSKKEGGYTLSKNIRLSIDKSYEHVAIIGPTGSGKSTSFFIPTILDSKGKYSLVVTDPKGELCKKTGPYLESLGMDIIKLEPLYPNRNKFYYNPLLVAETNTQIRELAQLILVNGSKAIEIQMGSSGGGGDQASWINMAIPLFTAALAYVKRFGKKKTINEAIDIILDIGIDKKELEKAEEIFKKDTIALKNFKIFKSAGGSDKTISSIKSVLSSNIQLFLDENVAEFTKTPFNLSSSTGKLILDETKLFDPRNLRRKPTALFVCVEEVKSDYVAPLMSVFYSQLLDTCMSNFDKEEFATPVLFMLDEFANIGVIPSIAKVAATARSRKIGLSIGLQGVEQLKRNYGEENANDILNNLKSKVFFSGLTGESAKYASDLSGFGTVESKNYSTGDNGQDVLGSLLKGPNVSISGVRRELYTPDEIRRLKDDKVLIIAHNRNPVEDDKNTYYTQKKYNKKIKE